MAFASVGERDEEPRVVTQATSDETWVVVAPPSEAVLVVVRGVSDALGPGLYSDATLLQPDAEAATSSSSNGTLVGALVGVLLAAALIIALLVVYAMRKRREALQMDFVPEPDEWELQPGDIRQESTIGSGAYGTVFRGELILRPEQHVQLATRRKRVPAAIKVLHPHLMVDDIRAFLDEANIMKQVSAPGHRNIVRLYGVVTQVFLLTVGFFFWFCDCFFCFCFLSFFFLKKKYIYIYISIRSGL